MFILVHCLPAEASSPAILPDSDVGLGRTLRQGLSAIISRILFVGIGSSWLLPGTGPEMGAEMLRAVDFSVEDMEKGEYKVRREELTERLVVLQQRAREAGVGLVVLF